MTTSDRRRFPRYPCRVPVKIEWGSEIIASHTRLLSVGGMFIESHDPFWVGATFSVVIGLENPVRVDCVVRMVEAGEGMGVEFLRISAEARAELEQRVTLLAVR